MMMITYSDGIPRAFADEHRLTLPTSPVKILSLAQRKRNSEEEEARMLLWMRRKRNSDKEEARMLLWMRRKRNSMEEEVEGTVEFAKKAEIDRG